MEKKTKVIDLLNQLFSLIIILAFTLFVFRVLTRIENNQLPAITDEDLDVANIIVEDMSNRHIEQLKYFHEHPAEFDAFLKRAENQ
jgi:hypothetical protein